MPLAEHDRSFDIELAAAPTVHRTNKRWLTDLKYRLPTRYLAAWAALALLILVAAAFAPSSMRGPSISVVTALAGILTLAALGQMLILMIGGLDLSVPAMIAISAGIVVRYGVPGANLPLVIALALAVAVAFSLVNGVLISVLRLNSLIVTLGTLGIASGAIGLWTGVSFSITGAAPAALTDFARTSFLNVNVCFLVAIVVAVLLGLSLSRTRAGRMVGAVGANRRAARTLGTHVLAIELGVFALAGLLYGLAGVLVASFIGTPDTSIGTPYQLATVTVAAIAGVAMNGGPGSVAPVIAASVFLQLLDQVIAIAGLPTGVGTIFQGVSLVVAVAAIAIWRALHTGARRLGSLRRTTS
ncbi:ABC transporter permease [Rathayibacter sp. VKM Ac-2928]|uniref:ABC transporter permease n=1 Tax=Rathayibacter sp. VKM Ac-2928 TaxID=2929479 RepID=UPI001FB25844|nr:ABC transporter permease [Rathayibacter sp. VKM Ac-2928]MCJ1684855.1 ABC transporter permease [Rathayibacter sp. VKM Ac-2928]